MSALLGLGPGPADALGVAGKFSLPAQLPDSPWLVFVLIALATLVSEDATCIATGLLVAQGRIGFVTGVSACAAGILIGDVLLYAAGRLLGRPALIERPLRWFVSEEAVERGSRWFDERGPWIIAISRFMPGTRLGTYVAAGLLEVPFFRFLLYFALAVSVWTPLLVGLSMLLGEQLAGYFEVFERWALPATVALAAALWFLVHLARRLSSWAGRRRLVGTACRLTRWEYWPSWAIYSPLAPWFAWLAIKHRGPTVFTAANPGIPDGGFVGESKAQIQDRIAPEYVARYRLIEAGLSLAEREAAVHDFMSAAGLGFPVVVKPDVGQRGSGVSVVHKPADLGAALSALKKKWLIQEHVPGCELGVFYVRRPGQAAGEIFSITEKRLPTLEGNGSSTLETLILRDDRAVCSTRLLFERFADRLEEVPTAGQQVPLVELGTHCQGALFLDGERFKTPELIAAVETISRSFDGFFFGRYDLRAPSWDAFLRGEDLKVVELNGVTSEATHIYDPRYSFGDALRVLARQWELAYEIGAANGERGVRPARVAGLLRSVVAFLRSS